MKRDYGKEIDTLREEMQRLGQLIENSAAKRNHVKSVIKKEVETEANLSGNMQKAIRARELKKEADANGWKGAIESISVFNNNDQGYYTDLPPVSTDSLLEMDSDLVARVLSTVAHKQRIAILKAILIEPLSASEMLEKLNMGTTGKVYHHINSLLSADLITQNDCGKYAFKGHRVHALLLILAGVQHILNERYSKGKWSVEEESLEPNES